MAGCRQCCATGAALPPLSSLSRLSAFAPAGLQAGPARTRPNCRIEQDPSDLFDYAPYVRTGALLWPDYWAQSVAPDFYAIAGPGTPPLEGTVETGQVLVHKRRCWEPLLLALFLNLQGSLYYNLLTNYMGAGDKETFPAAFHMLRRPVALVATPVGSAGLLRRPARAVGRADSPGSRLRSTAMVQHHPASGAPLLLHSNLNKWRAIPPDFGAAPRLWAVLTRPGYSLLADGQKAPLQPWDRALGFLGCAFRGASAGRCSYAAAHAAPRLPMVEGALFRTAPMTAAPTCQVRP